MLASVCDSYFRMRIIMCTIKKVEGLLDTKYLRSVQWTLTDTNPRARQSVLLKGPKCLYRR